MRISITPSNDVLHRYSNQLGALGEGAARKALARAVNRVTTTVHGRVISAVAKQSSIPKAIVARVIKKRLAAHKGSTAIEGVVYGTGSPLPLKVFGAKQFSWGVRAKIRGRMERFPSFFIYAGTYRSGKPVGNGHVFARTTKNSLPIELQTGPSVPEEMVVGEAKRMFETTVADMLPARVQHELWGALSGASWAKGKG